MGIFKKKSGKPTLFGKIGKGLFRIADSLGVPGAGLVADLLPQAPAEQVQIAQNAVNSIVSQPAMPAFDARNIAAQVKADLLASGFGATDASKIGSLAFTAAQLPPAEASAVLQDVRAQSQAQAAFGNAFTKDEMKAVLNAALDGAQEGAAGAYLDKTEIGKSQYKAAVNAKGKEIMPWVIGLMGGVIAIMAFKK